MIYWDGDTVHVLTEQQIHILAGGGVEISEKIVLDAGNATDTIPRVLDGGDASTTDFDIYDGGHA